MMPKRKYLTIEDRVKILDRVELGEKLCDLADEYGVTPSAISQLKKKRELILKQKQILDECGSSMKRRKFSGIESTQREQLLSKWMNQKRQLGETITGRDLAEQARMFNEKLNGSSSFKASPGFLHKFKKRHGLQTLPVENEKSSDNIVFNPEFTQSLSQLCRDGNYELDQVYNADETGLYWKLLPNTSVSHSKDEVVDSQIPVDRVTLMLCANTNGTHKIPLLVIGKSQCPRSFKDIKMLPVEYRGQPNAWITKELTLDWFQNIFLPAVREKHGTDKKILLLMDSALCHPRIEEFEQFSDMCRVVYIPSNVTSLAQPMGQGIIAKMKVMYKRNLLQSILTGGAERVVELLEKIDMVDVLNSLAYSWERVTRRDIRNSWTQLFPLDPLDTDYPELNNSDRLSGSDFLQLIRALPHCSEASAEDVEDWLKNDAHEPGWKMLSPQEIMKEEVKELIEEEYEGGEVKEDEDEERVVGESEALKSMDTVIRWYQTKSECTPEDMSVLQRIRNNLVSQVLEAKNLPSVDAPISEEIEFLSHERKEEEEK